MAADCLPCVATHGAVLLGVQSLSWQMHGTMFQQVCGIADVSMQLCWTCMHARAWSGRTRWRLVLQQRVATTSPCLQQQQKSEILAAALQDAAHHTQRYLTPRRCRSAAQRRAATRSSL